MTALSNRPNMSGARLRRAGFAVLSAVLAAGALMAAAHAEGRIDGTVTATTAEGFARLVFKFAEPVPAKIKLRWPVMVISFQRPVDVSVDRLGTSVPNFIGAARIDPDGGAIRIALARHVKINTTPAAERLYVDLLPENWRGVLPGLPKAEIERLAARAQEAERLLRQQREDAARQKQSMIRVKVASSPTFTRFVFDLPPGVNVASARGKGTLTLRFNRAIRWDLADALAAMPPTVTTIKASQHGGESVVGFELKGKPSVRTFREDHGFAVDVGHDGALAKSTVKSSVPAGTPAPLLAIAAPATVPAPEKAPAPAHRAADRAPADQSVPGLPPLVDMPAPPVAQAAKAAPKVSKPAMRPTAPVARPAQAVDNKTAAKAVPSPPAHQAQQPVQAAMPAPVKPKAKSTAKPAFADVVPPPLPAPDQPEAKAKSGAGEQSLVPPPNPKAPVVVGVHQGPDLLRVEFPFARPTPAAAFLRADMLWLVFDTKAKIDLKALKTRGGDMIRSVALSRGAEGEAILRIRLKQPQLVSLDTDGPAWMVAIGDIVAVPPHPLGVARNLVGHSRADIVIPFVHPASVHGIIDPEIGDRLLVVTALGPVRGFVRPRHYVELNLLASAQGVVVQPIADDVAVALAADKITLGRPGGLALSSAAVDARDSLGSLPNMPFDTQVWGFNRKTNFEQRQAELIRAAAEAPVQRRMQARLNLARFYLACGMAAEAKGVLGVALSDQKGVADVTGSVLSAVADVMLRRPAEALKELDQPQIGDQLDAPVWRAIAYAHEHKWAKARAGFKHVERAIATLPIELQRMAMMEALRTAIEVRDYDTASRLIDEFDSIGVPASLAPSYAVLVGQLDQGLGRTTDALSHYHMAAVSSDRPAAAQGRLHEIELRYSLGEMPRKKTIAALEMLTTVWRGDTTELKGLKLLAHLYIEERRYRDAFHVMRTALLAHPDSEITREIQDEAANTFDNLFLSHRGDALPPLKALALFYDYRQLTPIGPRGDEMIRRLADRLVSVDLLDQAAELLQHQVDYRLQGAARAQVATHLALIYLMNHKPRRALATLRATRAAGLAGELRDKRLLLEARALSDIGQHDLALEIIANIKGHTAMRLRADILWAAHRWRKAAEQIELLYGDRWKQFKPLSASERFDILRAAIGYALANETMSLARLRDRYMPKMVQGPDRRAFEIVSAPIGTANSDFQNVAQRVGNVSTLEAFLRDMRAAYPDKPVAAAKPASAAGASPQPAKPQVVPASAGAGSAQPGAAPAPKPAGKTAKPTPVPTGSILQEMTP